MRHDLPGADIEMLHLVEHRIEDDRLRAGFDDLSDLLRAPGVPAPLPWSAAIAI